MFTTTGPRSWPSRYCTASARAFVVTVSVDPDSTNSLSDNVVVLVLDPQSLGNGHQQMLFVQLRVTLNGFVLDALGDLPKFAHGLVLELFECVFH